MTVNRANPAQSNNANLSNLTISSGTLTPAFATGTLSYTDAVTNATASVTVTPTVADATATVTVNGTPVASGSASGAIALAVGANPITVVVTAQDGTTTQTYTVTVNRANPALTSQTISFGAAPALVLNGPAGTVSASATSGLAVSFDTATPGVCGVSGATVTPLALGLCTVTANQAGNGTYAAAPQVTQTIKVGFAGTTATASGIATATVSGGGVNCGFASAAFVLPPVAPPAGTNFPHGLFSFTLSSCDSSPVTIQVTYPSPLSTAVYQKYGPTPPNTPAGWYVMPGASVVGNVATFSITDGQIGDDDLTVNGTIVDAGGPSVPAAVGPVGASIPTLSEWGLGLLAVLLAMMAWPAGQPAARRRR